MPRKKIYTLKDLEYGQGVYCFPNSTFYYTKKSAQEILDIINFLDAPFTDQVTTTIMHAICKKLGMKPKFTL